MAAAVTPEPRRDPLRLVLWLGVALFLATRIAAIFTSSINWDEFALLARADQTLASGVLHTGGRPGLAEILVLPFVRDCRDEIASVRAARLVWAGFSLAYLVGVALLCARLQPDPRRRRGDALLGVALLALVPAFLEWSVHVRSDPIALAGGVWGGVALLASRRRPALALAAGAAVAVGYLGSQKVIYLAALMALLALADLLRAADWRPKRELLRAACGVVGLAAVLGGFGLASELAFEVHPGARPQATAFVPDGRAAAAVVDHFTFMRRTIGYSQYRAMLPTLVPHALLLAALVAASIAALRGGRLPPSLALAWSVLALGVAVMLFHASAFTYFWLTLGLFPALAFAVARDELERLFGDHRRLLHAAAACLVGVLALQSLFHGARLLRDTQAVQRESLAFVRDNFGLDQNGFHPEGALFCAAERQPLGIYLSEQIYRNFAGADRTYHVARFERTFEQREVRFLLESFRLGQFPEELRSFWRAHYQPYHASVYVAGRRLSGRRGEQQSVSLLVPGRYRWLPIPDPLPIEVDGRQVAAGEVVELAAGPHRLRFPRDVPDGLLVLAVDGLPSPGPRPFYQSP